jgi:metal-responsive CopG/Arc/MetJ family transcriptional regulator
MERINVRVDDQLVKELEAEARETGVRFSDVVRQALAEHIERRTPRKTCLDIARSIGIVGLYQDAPADLSTNPIHMEGFGSD